tara:strand:- start:139 stop:309 length:171 start_codon:yes stop_codon:yes gene_type:complete
MGKSIRLKLKRRVIVESNSNDIKKLNAFMNVMHDVAKDMGLNAYEDDVEHLMGADY